MSCPDCGGDCDTQIVEEKIANKVDVLVMMTVNHGNVVAIQLSNSRDSLMLPMADLGAVDEFIAGLRRAQKSSQPRAGSCPPVRRSWAAHQKGHTNNT